MTIFRRLPSAFLVIPLIVLMAQFFHGIALGDSTKLNVASQGSASQVHALISKDNEDTVNALAFRLRATCIRQPKVSLCSKFGSSQESVTKGIKDYLEKSEKSAKLFADNADFADSMKSVKDQLKDLRTKYGAGKIPTDEVKKLLTPHIDKIMDIKGLQAALKNLKPSKGSITPWLIGVAATAANESSTTSDEVVAAVGIIPIFGSVAGIINGAVQNDVESIVTSSIALGAEILIAAGAAPLGSAILVGLAVYSIGKAIYEWVATKEEMELYSLTLDAVPAGDSQKFFKDKLGVQWESSSTTKAALKIGPKKDNQKNKVLTLILSPEKDNSTLQAHFTQVRFQKGAVPTHMTYWQDGTKVTAGCKFIIGGDDEKVNTCTGADTKINVTPKTPVVVDTIFETGDSVCEDPGCPGKDVGDLYVSLNVKLEGAGNGILPSIPYEVVK
jgi:Diphtheria toxin, T domain